MGSVTLTLALLQSVNFLPRDVTRGVQVPGGEGVAGDFDATAINLNPAGIATLGATNIALVSTWLGDKNATLRGGGGWGAFLALPVPILHTAVGFSWQQTDQPNTWVADPNIITGGGQPLSTNARQITTTFASGGRNFSAGITYAHLFWENSPQYEGLDTIHFGLSARPSRFWAAGVTVRDLLAPTGRVPTEKFDRTWDLELAIRPLGDARLEVAGGAWIGEEKNTPIDARGRLLLRFIPGVTLFGQYDSVERPFDPNNLGRLLRDDRVLAGITLDTEFVGASYAALTSNRSSDQYAASGVMVRFSGERYPSLLAPTHIVRLRLDGGMSDRDFLHLLTGLRRLGKERGVEGILFEIDGFDVGWGKLEELRDEIARLRAAGKRVFAYFQEASTRHYYLASACEHIYINPGGGIRLTGGASTALFYKGLLDKLGVVVQVVKIAEYKSFPEVFTRTESSGPAREEREVYIKDILSRVVDHVAAERKLTDEQKRTLFDRGPYLAPQAKDAQLVDEIKYEDELDDALDKYLGHRVSIQDPPGAPERPQRWSAPKIAVIHVDGDIAPGKSQDIPLFGRVTGGDSVADAIKAARESPFVRAIVLRVDSPGGAVEPSEHIAREIELTHGKKPLVVSMGDVAASGGYMVSARGDRIFAEPSTITGSIGIFYYKPDLSGLLRTVGLSSETIKVGTHSDMDSLYRSWSEDEHKIAFNGISYFYDRFITMVHEGRGLTKERVNEIGRGRVWTAAMGQPIGLVDEFGGVMAAIAWAKKHAGMDEDAVVELVQLPHEPTSELQKLLKLAGGQEEKAVPPIVQEAVRAIPPILLWGRGLYARMPWAEMIEK